MQVRGLAVDIQRSMSGIQHGREKCKAHFFIYYTSQLHPTLSHTMIYIYGSQSNIGVNIQASRRVRLLTWALTLALIVYIWR